MTKIENLLTMVQEINAYNGSIENLDIFEMDMFDDIMESFNPMEIALKIHYGDFNPNNDYFRFDGYANLESLTDLHLENELIDYEEEILKEYKRIEEEGGF